MYRLCCSIDVTITSFISLCRPEVLKLWGASPRGVASLLHEGHIYFE
jgi:hypothetical protein